MDKTNNNNGLDQTYRLLALCARAESHPLMVEQLSRQIEAFTCWQELPAQAELHGMAPLLWHHLRRSGISLPAETERAITGLYLRHRASNLVHTRTLEEIVTLFEQAGIRPLVLKGLALAYEYYPDPALRPIRDIDLLLKQDEIKPALDLLADAGFRVDTPPASRIPGLLPKELTADSPLHKGLITHIELHHYDPRQRILNDSTPDDNFIGFDASPHKLLIGKSAVYVPAPVDTLNYLFRHLKKHLLVGTTNSPLLLKWVADIVSVVERHAETLDWDYLRRQDPAFLERLEVFYSLTPMPEIYAKIIPVGQVTFPSGLNQYPKGWPNAKIKKWRQVGLLRFFWQTFTPPSEWWLRLYYGIGKGSCFWYGQVVHRIRIIGLMIWLLIGKKLNIVSK